MLSVIPSHRVYGTEKFKNCQFSNIPRPFKVVAYWIVYDDDMECDSRRKSGFLAPLLGYKGVLKQRIKYDSLQNIFFSKCLSF